MDDAYSNSAVSYFQRYVLVCDLNVTKYCNKKEDDSKRKFV